MRKICKFIFPNSTSFVSLFGKGRYNCPTLNPPNGTYKSYFDDKIIVLNLNDGEQVCVSISDKEYLFTGDKNFDPDLYTIVRNRGGLGNQLFNYSYALWLANTYNIKVKIKECIESDRIEQLRGNFVLSSKVSYSTNIENRLFENFWNTESAIPPTIRYKKLQAYLIRSKWVNGNEEELRKIFTLIKPLDEANTKFLNEIQSSENPVLIHIRRGDYLKPKYTAIYARLEYTNYYDKAIALIKSKIKNPKFFLFCEDSKYIHEEFILKYPDTNFTYVDCNIDSEKKVIFELELMKNCKHFITANSTLSYWAATLATNPDKLMIGPTYWSTVDEIDNILGPSWIRV